MGSSAVFGSVKGTTERALIKSICSFGPRPRLLYGMIESTGFMSLFTCPFPDRCCNGWRTGLASNSSASGKAFTFDISAYSNTKKHKEIHFKHMRSEKSCFISESREKNNKYLHNKPIYQRLFNTWRHFHWKLRDKLNYASNMTSGKSKFDVLKIISDVPQWCGMGLGMPPGSHRMYFIILEHLQNLLKIFTKKQNPPWEAVFLM